MAQMERIWLDDIIHYKFDGINCVDYIVKIIKVYVKRDGEGCMAERTSCNRKYGDSIIYLSGGDVIKMKDIDHVIPRGYKRFKRMKKMG